MKQKNSFILILLICGLAFVSSAGADGTHHESREAGPNGGRVVTAVQPNLEFFLMDDGRVQITFLDEDGSTIPPDEQVVSLVGGDRSDPTMLAFVREGSVLVSEKEMDVDRTIPVVLQVKATPAAKTVRERFNLNLGECPTCDYKEYACVCHEDEDEEHE